MTDLEGVSIGSSVVILSISLALNEFETCGNLICFEKISPLLKSSYNIYRPLILVLIRARMSVFFLPGKLNTSSWRLHLLPSPESPASSPEIRSIRHLYLDNVTWLQAHSHYRGIWKFPPLIIYSKQVTCQNKRAVWLIIVVLYLRRKLVVEPPPPHTHTMMLKSIWQNSGRDYQINILCWLWFTL